MFKLWKNINRRKLGGQGMKDYEIKMVYTMYVGLEADNEEQAIEQAKQTAEEQHGNRISEFAVFTIEEE
jgi:hypothetical protein